MSLAQQFDKFQRQGLFRFLCLVEAQRRAEAEPEVKAINAENSVRLMSIHQSKGLEFPVVAVADLGKRFNLADLRAEIILDERFGLCPQIKPPHTGKRYPSLPYWLAKRRQTKELLGEELRLLYVAMTRARDMLLLSLSVSESTLEKRWARTGENAGLWFSEQGLNDYPVSSLRETKLLRWFFHDEKKLLTAAEAGTDGPDSELNGTPEGWNQLYQRLAWEYPFLGATRTPAKASVTALRRRSAMLMDEVIGRQSSGSARFHPQLSPRRAGALRSDAAEIGSAHHKFLQMIALDRTGSVEDLKNEIRRLEQNHAMNAEETAVIDLEALAEFWNSPLGQKIRGQAHYVQRISHGIRGWRCPVAAGSFLNSSSFKASPI